MASGIALIPAPGGALEAGLGTTDASGLLSITFSKAYASKPKLIAMPDVPLATDAVTTQIDSWTQDAEGNYTGCTLATADDGGKAEAGCPVIWAIVSE